MAPTHAPPNKKMQLTIAKAVRLATPSLASFAIAADLQRQAAMPAVFIYGFGAAFSGDSEYEWRHPEKDAWHKCMLFLAQESLTRDDDLARAECAKFGFKDVTFEKGALLRVEALNTEQFRGFTGFYEDALNTGSVLVYYPNKKVQDGR